MLSKTKRSEDDGAVASTSSGGNQQAKQCVYCLDEPRILKQIWNKSVCKSICVKCEESEKFTFAALIKEVKKVADDVNVESIRKMDEFSKYNIPENSDGTDVLLGFLFSGLCDLCNFNYRNDEASVRGHWNNRHLDEERPALFEKCIMGCDGLFFLDRSTHEINCGIFCPYFGKCMENKKLPRNNPHFNVHKIMMCPIMSCPFAVKEKDVEGLCKHILDLHVYQFKEEPSFTPKKIRGNIANQKCYYCEAECTAKISIQVRSALRKRPICSGCELKERFPLAQLKEMLKGVGSMPMDDIVLLKEKIREAIGSTDAPVGFLDLNKCRYCLAAFKRSQTFEEHEQQAHPGIKFEECKRCGQYFDSERSFACHYAKCEQIKCPYEKCLKQIDTRDDEHFNKPDHQVYFCPIFCCPAVFKRDELERFKDHFQDEHVLKIHQKSLN